MARGFTAKQFEQLRQRDGDVCVWRGYDTGRLVPQHRAGRGLGGSKLANTIPNGLVLDSLINSAIESDPDMQRLALARGIKIPRWAEPAQVPVFYAHEWQWYRLTGDTREPVDGAEAMDMMYAVYSDGYQAFGWRT